MSGTPSIRVCSDPAATSAAAAEAIALALREAVEERGRADWATTGGSTPLGIYRALRAPAVCDLVPWPSVHVWWGDDRFVRRDDPLSNVLPFDLELADAVPLRRSNIHPMPMNDGLDAGGDVGLVAAGYDSELRGAGLPVASSGFPILDVVLVGIGEDGHVLSVFPGSPLFDSRAWVSGVPAPTHIAPHVARVSLNPGLLAATRLPILVAHGADKAAILAAVLGPDLDECRWPAQIARRDGAIWFLDRAAAASLPA